MCISSGDDQSGKVVHTDIHDKAKYLLEGEEVELGATASTAARHADVAKPVRYALKQLQLAGRNAIWSHASSRIL